MKQVIFGIVGGSFVLLTMVLVMTVDGRSIRENELDEALETAVWKVMDNLVATGHYSVADEEEFVADFCQALLEEIQVSDGVAKDDSFRIQVDVTGVDVQQGLLSVSVEESYTSPNGKVCHCQCDATAILEREVMPEEVTLAYMVEDRLYQQYGVLSGNEFLIPSTSPKETGKTFCYWMDTDTGQAAVFPEKAEEDKEYVAVFETNQP